MKRRRFLEWAGMGVCSSLVSPQRAAASFSSATQMPAPESGGDAYGSGYFGRWITDEFGLPAYRYTCNQVSDRKAEFPTDKVWRSAADQTHQVGNDRLVAAVSNYGYVQVRQDEGSPKFLNDYCPEQHRYGGGIGFLAGEGFALSTWYSGFADSFDRIFGIGYFRKRVAGHGHEVDQVILAPFGDDPVVISRVTITNQSSRPTTSRWVEYWGCHNYQMSYRALMEAAVPAGATNAPQLRREFGDRFAHRFELLKNGAGLLERQSFQGRAPEEVAAWQRTQAALRADPNGFFGGPVAPLAPGASMEDFHPPATFLVSLDAPGDGFATNASRFFQGGIDHPAGMDAPLDNDLSASGPESAFFAERKVRLRPGESRTLSFLYGYLPEGFTLEGLVARYSAEPPEVWPRSSSQWKKSCIQFRAGADSWVEREVAWSGYYLRSGLTYDSFFREHILSQGQGYQYLAGLQGAARDPLQHALPFVFTDPQVVREVLRYTIKETQSDGSLPYGIVGSGVPMPCRYRPSDLELWLLWLASEYVLATRDRKFLEEKVAPYPGGASPEALTISQHLARAYERIATRIGVGKHGLMRLFNGDWNDSIVVNRLTPAQVAEVFKEGESVLNGAMASYVLDYYARMRAFTQQTELATAARATAEAQRQAVRQQWTGQWFRRAWLGEELGWAGEKQLWLEPQPWAILGGVATPEQVKTLVSTINELTRRRSPIGALLQSQPDPTMKDDPGVGTNGGIFAAINGTLIWALARVDGSMAWDEWKKNSLARHAATYPEMWFGIWSGPDAYNSVLAKNPGWTPPDFPVMNMHPHAWPLYSAAKLLGLEFEETGINLCPALPLSHYEFASPLLGFKKSRESYSGWYAPLTAGRWEVVIALPDEALKSLRHMVVNGVTYPVSQAAHEIRFTGESKPGAPLRWQLGGPIRESAS